MRHLDMHCVDCSVDTDTINEFYMVHDHIWEQAVPDITERESGVLCVGCLEKRIGRQLCAADFTDARVNKQGDYSTRLLSRLTAS